MTSVASTWEIVRFVDGLRLSIVILIVVPPATHIADYIMNQVKITQLVCIMIVSGKGLIVIVQLITEE